MVWFHLRETSDEEDDDSVGVGTQMNTNVFAESFAVNLIAGRIII